MRYLLLCSLAVMIADARGVERLTLVAERSMATGREQIGLSIGKSEARLTLSSNFVDEPRAQVELGLFTSEMTPELSQERELLETDLERVTAAAVRGKEFGKPPRPDSPHDTVWMLNGNGLESDSVYLPNAQSVLRRVSSLGKWVAQDAVRIRMGAKGVPEVTRLGSASSTGKEKSGPLDCKARTAMSGADLGFVCAVPGYGTAYLAPSR